MHVSKPLKLLFLERALDEGMKIANVSECALSPGNMLSTLCKLPSLFFKTNLWSRFRYHPHFFQEGIVAERLYVSCLNSQVSSKTWGLNLGSLWLQTPDTEVLHRAQGHIGHFPESSFGCFPSQTQKQCLEVPLLVMQTVNLVTQ